MVIDGVIERIPRSDGNVSVRFSKVDGNEVVITCMDDADDATLIEVGQVILDRVAKLNEGLLIDA